MKTALPFKSSPKQTTKLIGDEDCGILEMPVYGSLLWHELQAVRKADGGYNLFKESAMAAGKIAKKEGRTDLRDLQLQLISIMQMGMGLPTQVEITDDAMRIRVEHADLLNALEVDISAWNDRRMLAAVTALVQNRLEGFEEWDEILVQRNITNKLMDHLYRFFREEEMSQVEGQAEDRSEVDEEEQVGKPPVANGKPRPSPTGEQSSGDSNSSTPATKTSPTTASEASPSSESSEPSKQAKNKAVAIST